MLSRKIDITFLFKIRCHIHTYKNQKNSVYSNENGKACQNVQQRPWIFYFWFHQNLWLIINIQLLINVMRNVAVDQSLNFRHWQTQIDGWKNILLWSKMNISQSWSGSTLPVMFFFLVFEKKTNIKTLILWGCPASPAKCLVLIHFWMPHPHFPNVLDLKQKMTVGKHWTLSYFTIRI